MDQIIPKRILLQGATGSIGRSVLDVVRAHSERFRVVGLAVHTSIDKLLPLIDEFRPLSVAVGSIPSDAEISAIKNRLHGKAIFFGPDAPAQQAHDTDYNLLVNAMLGSSGMDATFRTLSRGIPVALANKETLVAAGTIMMKTAAATGTRILPIDSEHSAIFQCLLGENPAAIRKIWLTTSGGPFRHRRFSELDSVTVEEALNHPTWKMGPKITIDSASLFNKGLEVIEAERLFGIPADRIGVVIHPQSVVHSLVEFIDGSIKAQLSIPDMKLPILSALSYPDRISSDLVQTDIERLGSMTFEPVPQGQFPCLECAYEALRKGGTAPAAVSAADEIAVDAFLKKQIRFVDIPTILRDVLRTWPDEEVLDLQQVQRADHRAREMAATSIAKLASRTMSPTCC